MRCPMICSLGDNSQVGPDYARGLAGHYFNLRKASIYGGSNEIQRNIIAKAVLGLLMDFSFTEEQTLLRNSLSRYLADKYSYEDWRKFTRGPEGRDPTHWKQFAELGLFAAPCRRNSAAWAVVRSKAWW